MSSKNAQDIVDKVGVRGFAGIFSLIAGIALVAVRDPIIALGVVLIVIGLVLITAKLVTTLLEIMGMSPSQMF